MRGDQLDGKILELLCLNCRVSYAQIAEACGVAATTIVNRIERLEESGVISNYLLVTDTRPFGFTKTHVLIRFEGKGYDIEVLCKKLALSDHALWITSYLGTYDAQVIVDSHERLPLATVLRTLFEGLEQRVREYELFSTDIELAFTHLLPVLDYKLKVRFGGDDQILSAAWRRHFPASESYKLERPSLRAVDILKILSGDPRISLSALAEEVDCDRQTAKKEILKLIEKGIILNFGISIDHTALGYVSYHLLFRLKQEVDRRALKKFFLSLPGIFFAGSAVGIYDLSVYVYARDPRELGVIIQSVRKQLGTVIQHYELLIYDKVHHWKPFHEAVYSVLATERKAG